MNVGQARIVIRERGVTEILDLGFRFVIVLGGNVYLQLFLLLVVPAVLLIGLSALFGLGWIYVWGIAITLLLFTELPFTIAASRLLFSKSVTTTEVLASSLRLLPRYSVCLLIIALMLAVSSLLPIFLPIALARTLYLREIATLEGTTLSASLKRSKRFTQQRIWSALEACAGLFALTAAFALLCQILASTLSSDLFELAPLAELVSNRGSLFAAAGLVLASPFVATTRFLCYIDGRTRREAWDVQVRFMQLGREARARAA